MCILRGMKPWLVRALILGLLASALCLVPLFGVPGYEAALALSLPSAILGVHLGLAKLRRARAGTRSDGEGADARPLRTVLGWWLGAVAEGLVLLVLPAGILTIHALAMRSCDPVGRGLAWLLMMPATTLPVGAALGVVAGVLMPTRARATMATVLAIVLSLAHTGWRFWASPPIFMHDPFGGWFAGSIYDEALSATGALWAARSMYLLAALAAVLLTAAFLDGNTLKISLRRLRGPVFFLALVPFAGALTLYAERATLGIAIDATDLGKILGAELRTDHFVIHYSPSGPWAKGLPLHALEHELRYRQLRTLLGDVPTATVHSFLFDSPQQKQRLMGAANTFVAKPWRHEIYLHPSGWPHTVLMHELAHVFWASAGDRWFGISRVGLRFNVGLVEGVAVASAWERASLDPHEAARVLLKAGALPSLSQILSLDFFGAGSAAAYDVAGSFCRWLLDTQGGPAKLRALYHGAGSDAAFQAAYGRPRDALELEWRAFLLSPSLPPAPPDEEAVLSDRLRRPGIFHRRCPHELALRREAANEKLRNGDPQAGLALLDEVCRDEPDEPANLIVLVESAISAEKLVAARAALTRLLAHPKLSVAQRARAFVLDGDLSILSNQPSEKAYAAALALPLDVGARRIATLKRLLTQQPPGPTTTLLRRYVFPTANERNPALTLLTAAELSRLDSKHALFPYLYAKQLEQHGRYVDAADAADAALVAEVPLPDDLFVAEALRMLGRCRFRAGQLVASGRAWERLATLQPRARVEADDWQARIAEAQASPQGRALFDIPGGEE